MGATVVEVASGHVAMVSHPDEVADLIRTAAEAPQAEQASDRFDRAVSPEASLTFPSSWPRAPKPVSPGRPNASRRARVMPLRPMPSHPEGTVATGGVEGMLTAMAAVPRASVWPARTAFLPHNAGNRSRRRLRRHAGRRTRRQTGGIPSALRVARRPRVWVPAPARRARSRRPHERGVPSRLRPPRRFHGDAVSRPGCSRSRGTR